MCSTLWCPDTSQIKSILLSKTSNPSSHYSKPSLRAPQNTSTDPAWLSERERTHHADKPPLRTQQYVSTAETTDMFRETALSLLPPTTPRPHDCAPHQAGNATEHPRRPVTADAPDPETGNANTLATRNSPHTVTGTGNPTLTNPALTRPAAADATHLNQPIPKLNPMHATARQTPNHRALLPPRHPPHLCPILPHQHLTLPRTHSLKPPRTSLIPNSKLQHPLARSSSLQTPHLQLLTHRPTPINQSS